MSKGAAVAAGQTSDLRLPLELDWR